MAEFVLRVIISDHDIRKIKLPNKPRSVEELHQSVQSRLNLTSFTILYEDKELNSLCTLNDIDELSSFGTVKILEIVSAEEVPVVLMSEPSPSNFRTNCGWPKEFIIPSFDHDVEFLLSKGNAVYKEHGTLLILPKGAKGSVLQKLTCAMYDYKAYPIESEFQAVAEALISKHPCLREAGSQSGFDGWRNSLMFKMGNYRTEIRKAGGEEVMINSGKRSRYRPDLPPARAALKKPRRAEANFLPNLPHSETVESQDGMKKTLQEELHKAPGARNNNTIRALMTKTFALRRQHIVKDCPRVQTILNEWPAIFLQQQVEAVTFQLKSKLNFILILDQYCPKLQSKVSSYDMQ